MSERRETTRARPAVAEETETDIDADATPPGGELEPPGAPTLRQLVAPRTMRRLAPRKLIAFLILALATLATLGILGVRSVRLALTWLAAQPQYAVRFEAIVLEPPPPGWIRSGAAGLLDRVQTQSTWRDQPALSLLNLDMPALADAFRRGSPWVRNVLVIERNYPNRLTVGLEYREPVAYLPLQRESGASAGQCLLDRDIVLDGDGVVLPGDDLDLTAAGSLIPLTGLVPRDASSAALAARPGRALRSATGTEPGDDPAAAAIRQAARLAAFFRDRGAIRGMPGTPCAVVEIQLDRDGDFWIFAHQVGAQATVRWGPAPGAEPPGEPDAARKWQLLADWLDADHVLAEVPWPRFLAFERDRLVVRDPQQPD